MSNDDSHSGELASERADVARVRGCRKYNWNNFAMLATLVWVLHVEQDRAHAREVSHKRDRSERKGP